MLATTYLTGPYDGAKSSVYSINVNFDGKVCGISAPLLLEDHDIAD